jgi:methylenetetrahydrofolate--tRNA-(uracil-5-)-methyltransferase
MNVNFGLFPALSPNPDAPKARGKERKQARRRALTERALSDLDRWLKQIGAALEPIQPA